MEYKYNPFTNNLDLTGLSEADSLRLSALENFVFKIAYYEIITTISGQISKPQGSTILFDQWANGVDAIVSKTENGRPTFEDSEIDVVSFDSSGSYVLSLDPAGIEYAIIYYLSIRLVDFGNLSISNIIEYAEFKSDPQTSSDADLLEGLPGSYYLDYNNFTNTPQSTDDLPQGTTNLYSQWNNVASGISYDSGNVGVGTISPLSKLTVKNGNIELDDATILSYNRSINAFSELRLEGSPLKLKDSTGDVIVVDGGIMTAPNNPIFAFSPNSQTDNGSIQIIPIANTVINKQFTISGNDIVARVAGFYRINMNCNVYGNSQKLLVVAKNGVEIKYAQAISGDSQWLTMTNSAIIELAVNDYLTFKFRGQLDSSGYNSVLVEKVLN